MTSDKFSAPLPTISANLYYNIQFLGVIFDKSEKIMNVPFSDISKYMNEEFSIFHWSIGQVTAKRYVFR